MLVIKLPRKFDKNEGKNSHCLEVAVEVCVYGGGGGGGGGVTQFLSDICCQFWQFKRVQLTTTDKN